MWNPFVSFKYDRKSDGVAFFGIPSFPFPCHSDTPYAYPLPLSSLLHFSFFRRFLSLDSFPPFIHCAVSAVLCSVAQLSRVQLCDSGLQPTRPLCPWNFPGKNTRVGCHFLLQGIFLTQGLNPHLLHWQVDSLPLHHLGSPKRSLVFSILLYSSVYLLCSLRRVCFSLFLFHF